MVAPTRVNLGLTISGRDSSLSKDALLLNCYPEKPSGGEGLSVVRRFGLTQTNAYTAGQALGMFTYNGVVVSIIGTTCRLGAVSLGTVDGTSQYQFALTATNVGFVIKNNAKAYYYNGTTLAVITDVNYPSTTVPGVATLDGYQFYLTSAGSLLNSNLNSPTTFNALNFLAASPSSYAGVAVTSYLNYIVAFTTGTTAFFSDNANAVGSPLIINTSATLNIGCASAASIVQTRNTVIWVGQTKQRGRSVYILDGLASKSISNTFIDRALAKDDLANVYAYFIEINGHFLYILTLKTSNLTLVYDFSTNEWHSWSSSVLGTGLSVTQGSLDIYSRVTLTVPNHKLSNGAIVKVSGLNTAQYLLGTFLVNVIDANTITYQTQFYTTGGINSSALDALAVNVDPPLMSGFGTLTVTPYNQNYFSCSHYTYANNVDYLLNETTGVITQIAESLSNDNGPFIYTSIRTDSQDFNTTESKYCSSMELVGDKTSGTAYMSYSDDDFNTFAYYRPLDLNSKRSTIRRNGSFRRRAWQIIYIGQYPVRFYGLDLYMTKGLM